MGSKPDVIFVAGLGAVESVYQPALKALRRVVDIHGADHPAELPDKIDWEFFFRPIDEAAKNLDSFTLLGHSLGGSVALKYAARHPRKVHQVIAVAPPLFPFTRARLTRAQRLGRVGMALWAGHIVHFVRAYRSISARITYEKAKKLYDFAGRIDLAPDLPDIKQAVILYPEQEEVIPRWQLERVQQEFPNVRTRLVPGSHQSLPLAPRRLIPILQEELRV